MSNSKLEIPGLLSSQKSKLTEAEVQAQREMFAKQQALMNKPMRPILVNRKVDNNSIPDSMTATYELTLEQIKSKFGQEAMDQATKAQSYVSNGVGTGQPYWGIDQPNLLQPQPYQQPWDLDDYKKFFPQEPKKYGPSPSRQSGAGKQDWEKELMNYMKPKKSAFEEILDAVFTTAEKEQLLIDMGYILERSSEDQSRPIISRKLADGTTKVITNSLEDLFLKEVTVKFKNLLLAKATLKLKL